MLDRLDVDLWPVQLVVSEAVANAVVHAYPDRAPGQVRLEASLEDKLLTVVVGGTRLVMRLQLGAGA